MVGEEHLESLDFMLWMSGSYRASLLTHTNQSTVIRRANHVLQTFCVGIHRSSHGWIERGGNDLLIMERAVHQKFRFRRRRPLRLHVPFWSHRSVQEQLPNGWITNPPDPSHCCENPLQLLRERVIDACILTPTQIDPQAQDLFFAELYHSRIDLTLFPSRSSDKDSNELNLEKQIAKNHLPHLQLFGFLPRTCRVISRQWFRSFFLPLQDQACSPTEHKVPQVKVAFLTPEMRSTLHTSCLVDTSSPRSYRETLVVLLENAQEPQFLQLIAALVRQFSNLDTPLPALRNRGEAHHHRRSTKA